MGGPCYGQYAGNYIMLCLCAKDFNDGQSRYLSVHAFSACFQCMLSMPAYLAALWSSYVC